MPTDISSNVVTSLAANSRSYTAAVYYHPDGFDTSRKTLMGRHAAGEEFLKALTRHGTSETLYCYSKTQEHFQDFTKRVQSFAQGLPKTNLKANWIPWDKWQMLSQPGCLFYPGPVLGDLAWQRRYTGERTFSLCGVTHTTATHAVMDGLGDLLIAPLQPWDAVICTSQSVRDTVNKVLSAQSEYIKDRFQLAKAPHVPVQLPIIPLGVDCDRFIKSPDVAAQHRAEWRQTLKIAQDDFTVLYVGRFSFHAKAHPMPLFRSLEEVAQKSGKPVHLIMAGWFPNDSIKDEFFKASQTYAPSVSMSFVDGRAPKVRETIWYAADVFSSFSDNIQETFGLTPLEGMAAGLPVVISDWNGYRETAQQGISGFLVQTWMSPPGSSADLAALNAAGAINYDEYIGHQSQFSSIDIQACVDAFMTLMKNPSLSKQMGAAGQQRAKTHFDWSVIIRQYETLWSELEQLRASAPLYGERTATVPPIPLRQDPTVLFQSYPTNTVTPDTLVSPTHLSDMDNFEKLRAVTMNTFVSHRVAIAGEISQVFAALTKDGPKPLSALLALVPADRHKALMLTIIWLSKMGLLHLS